MMKKYRFVDDYSEGCHPRILEALMAANTGQQEPYGLDEHSEQARQLLLRKSGQPDLAIHFVASGTIANICIAAAITRSHESIITTDIGHIVSSEAGAIDALGRQLIKVPARDGKMTEDALDTALQHLRESPFGTVPRCVYISNATEFGTVYTLAELRTLSETCRSNDLLLWLDGARLGAALVSTDDLSLTDIAELTDVFWIGGTKAGGLAAEAIVISNAGLRSDFATILRQRGAVLAKSRLAGVQFLSLFSDDLFFELSRHACAMARKLAEGIRAADYRLYVSAESNMVFAILPDRVIERLQQSFELYAWKKLDNDLSVVRFVTSWATPEHQVDALVALASST
ncbi:MAG: beta-eliminating lyase-related protein [Gammaproteobacteria bacterium]|nr:beta-eliminating lyase-related protein [Gammaproteobacteria bacterium]